MIDNDSDFNPITASTKLSSYNTRTLLLAPPSISSHEENLRNVLASHDRSVTDLQMLDRLSVGLVTLPDATYDLILILTDADGTRAESTQLLTRGVFGRIAQALKPGGKLEAQDGSFGKDAAGTELREAILAGLVAEGVKMVKPDYSTSEAVPLRLLRRKDKGQAVSNAGPLVATAAIPLNGKRKSVDMTQSKPAGVGFVDFSDDFEDPIITGEEDDDEELIDEDTLLTEEDLKRPVKNRGCSSSITLAVANKSTAECIPRIGKRRRACKDCTCGLAEKIAAEDAAKRESADAQLKTLKLGADDLAEVDFTVQGKIGSCGNCSLGDAFRCDGCVRTSFSLNPHSSKSRDP
jgi:hypothetical protein